ncbi:MAG: hypothetical protein L0K65_08670 [Actinomyces sp.]|nr:hypothetical protein [Actinomyces sp.]
MSPQPTAEYLGKYRNELISNGITDPQLLNLLIRDTASVILADGLVVKGDE